MEQVHKWVGIPFRKRYSESKWHTQSLIDAMRKIDPMLDLKLYLPTEKWHVIRHQGSLSGPFVRVWELDDRPDLGLQREPGYWIIDALRAGDMQGAAANRVEQIDKANDQIEASLQREVEAQSKDFAAEIRKPLQRLYDFGPDSDHKGVF